MARIQYLLPVATLVAGAGIGYLAGRAAPEPNAEANVRRVVTVVETTPQEKPPSVIAAGGEVEPKKPEGTDSSPITETELQGRMKALGVKPELFAYSIASLRRVAELQDRLRSSDVAEMARTMSSSTLPPRNDVYRMVMSSYAEKDPQAAWALANGIKIAGTRRTAQLAVLAALADRDPVQALALIETLTDPAVKRQMRMSTIQSFAQKDPQRAWELYRQSGQDTGDNFNQISSSIFSSWASRDPEAAKAAAARLTGSMGEQARNTVAYSMAQTDPQAAWAYASSLPFQGDGYRSPLVRVISSWAQIDPQGAVQAAMSIREAGIRGAAISSAVSAWANSDFDGALKYAIAEQDSTIRSDIFRSMSTGQGIDRRKLLTAMIEHMPAGDNYQRTVSGLFNDWARTMPAEAAAALNELPQGRLYSELTSRVASQWSENQTDKRELLDWMRQLPPGDARRNAYRSAFSQWSSQNPQEALAALQTLSPEDRKNAIQAVGSGWSQRDPEAVIRWSAGIDDPAQRGDVIRNAIGQWARYSPEEASRYVQTLPKELQESSVRTLVDQWASKDVAAAADWLQAQPVTPAKDGAIEVIVRRIAQEDPATAIAWASTMADQGKRNAQVERLARDWIRQDATNARAWIGNSSLPEETRQKLLK